MCLNEIGLLPTSTSDPRQLAKLHTNAVELRGTVGSRGDRRSSHATGGGKQGGFKLAISSADGDDRHRDDVAGGVTPAYTRDRKSSAFNRLKRMGSSTVAGQQVSATGGGGSSHRMSTSSKKEADRTVQQMMDAERRKQARKQLAVVGTVCVLLALVNSVVLYAVFRSTVWWHYTIIYGLISPLVLMPVLYLTDACDPDADLVYELTSDMWANSQPAREAIILYWLNLIGAVLFTVNIATFTWKYPLFSLGLYFSSFVTFTRVFIRIHLMFCV